MRHIRHFFSRWQNWLGFLLVLGFVMMAIAAPIVSPMDPKEPGIFQKVGRTRLERLKPTPRPPYELAPLGTLPYQYDVFHTLVWGARDALSFGLMVALISGLFGVIFGAVAGYAGGVLDTVMMRIADAFLAFPVIAGVVFLQQLMATTIEAAGGIFIFNTPNPNYPGGQPLIMPSGEASLIQSILSIINPLVLSFILFSWMPYARLVNSMVLSMKKAEFVQASRALGASSARTIFRHLIPNSIAPAVILVARDVGGLVILQATLTFVHVGGNSPWGDMLYRGRDWILNASGLLAYWWVYIPATVAVMLFGIAWNLLGDGLNDLLDPTATYEYGIPSFWSRMFRKNKKRVFVENDSSDSGHETLIPPKQTVQPAPVAHISTSNGANAVLLAAREAVSNGNIPLALHSYQHLIQRGKSLDEVLADIAKLVKKSPRDPQTWQTLGDALARTGDVVHATQSYEQARKLVEYESL